MISGKQQLLYPDNDTLSSHKLGKTNLWRYHRKTEGIKCFTRHSFRAVKCTVKNFELFSPPTINEELSFIKLSRLQLQNLINLPSLLSLAWREQGVPYQRG